MIQEEVEFALRSCCNRDPSILYQSSVRGESGLGASAAASSLLSTTREVLRVWGECEGVFQCRWAAVAEVWIASSKMNQGVKVVMGTKIMHEEVSLKKKRKKKGRSRGAKPKGAKGGGGAWI